MAETLPVAAKAPTAPNKPVGEGSIINGRVLVWMDGSLRHATPAEAWSEWLWLTLSPLPETRARARVIRAALDQIGHLQ